MGKIVSTPSQKKRAILLTISMTIFQHEKEISIIFWFFFSIKKDTVDGSVVGHVEGFVVGLVVGKVEGSVVGSVLGAVVGAWKNHIILKILVKKKLN